MLKDLVLWVQTHAWPFAHWPSWAVEALGGLTLAIPGLLLAATGHGVRSAVAFVAAQALSELYERFADPHGYSAQDVVERARVIVAVAATAVAAW